jgi:hypothetical protein
VGWLRPPANVLTGGPLVLSESLVDVPSDTVPVIPLAAAPSAAPPPGVGALLASGGTYTEVLGAAQGTPSAAPSPGARTLPRTYASLAKRAGGVMRV